MYKTYPPVKELSPYIECYWRWKTGAQPGDIQFILPDASPELIVHLGCAPEARSGDTGWQQQPQAFLYCAAHRCLELRMGQSMDVFAARFRPWGLGRFSGGPMSEMLDREVSPSEALGPLGKLLVNVARRAPNDGVRTGRLCELLAGALDEHNDKARTIRTLIKALGGPGNPAWELAENLERSTRTVNRIWRRLVGMSPRSYLKLMRFHRALGLIEGGESMASVAAECGFADQAHMARQIKEIAGLPPRRLQAWLGRQIYQDLYASRPSAPWK